MASYLYFRLKQAFCIQSKHFSIITNQSNFNSGVCDAIDKGYLKALVFAVHAFKDDEEQQRWDDGETDKGEEIGILVETHQMVFTYPAHGNVGSLARTFMQIKLYFGQVRRRFHYTPTGTMRFTVPLLASRSLPPTQRERNQRKLKLI